MLWCQPLANKSSTPGHEQWSYKKTPLVPTHPIYSPCWAVIVWTGTWRNILQILRCLQLCKLTRTLLLQPTKPLTHNQFARLPECLEFHQVNQINRAGNTLFTIRTDSLELLATFFRLYTFYFFILTDELFSAHVMSLRMHITQALHDNNLITSSYACAIV